MISKTGIQVAADSMTISKNGLTIDSFDISCSAFNAKFKGSALKTYTTSN